MQTPQPHLAPVPPEHTTVIRSDQQIASVTFVEEDGRWFKVLNSVIDSGEWASLSDAARNVLIVLARHANSEGSSSPSLAALMHCTGLRSRSGVYKALKELSDGSRLIAKSEVTKAYGLFPGRPFASRRRSSSPENPPAPVSTSVDNLHEERRKRSTPVDGQSTPVDKVSTPVDTSLRLREREEEEEGRTPLEVADCADDDGGRGGAMRRLVSEAHMDSVEAERFLDRFGVSMCLDALENALWRKRNAQLTMAVKAYCWRSAGQGYGLFDEVKKERQNARLEDAARLLSRALNATLTPEWKSWVVQVFKNSRAMLRDGVVSPDEVHRLPHEELARRVMETAQVCAGKKPSEYRRAIEAARQEGALA